MPCIIITHFLKPGPDRRQDYEAVYSDYDFGGPIGFGRTEADAVLDLIAPDMLAMLRDQVIEICASAAQSNSKARRGS